MHTGSRAFCFLMALAATGAECASAAVTPSISSGAGHYRIEAQPAGESVKVTESNSLSAVVVANHVLAVMAVSQAIAPLATISAKARFPGLVVSTGICAYDADGRCMASIADANERQLLFVKITRG